MTTKSDENPQKKTPPSKPDISSLTLEQCFEELETIVDALENQTTSLEESIDLFERGMKLSKRCSVDLTKMERRIQIIIEDSKKDSAPRLEDFKSPSI